VELQGRLVTKTLHVMSTVGNAESWDGTKVRADYAAVRGLEGRVTLANVLAPGSLDSSWRTG